MHYRTLGKTGFEVSEIGYGTWGIGKAGWTGADDEQSLRGLNAAIDRGVNFIDTALGYGNGHSERLVGQVVRARRERVYVATKISPKNLQWPARPGVQANDAFPADHVIARTEESLRNLGLETVDIQQFHVWSNEWVGQGDWLEGVQRIATDLGISLDQLPEVALRYPLSHPAVSTIIPGMRQVRHVEQNVAIGDGRGLPPEQVQRLKAHRWVRNFYE